MSLVNKDIPLYTIAGGVPIRVLGTVAQAERYPGKRASEIPILYPSKWNIRCTPLLASTVFVHLALRRQHTQQVESV